MHHNLWKVCLGLLAAGAWSGGTHAGEKPKQELIELGKRVEARIAKLREIREKKPVRWEVASKEQIRKYLLTSLAEQYKTGEMEREGEALKALGLLPEALAYKEYVVALYEEQVGGYYDPKKETFYLADWIPPTLQESIIAHELTHALQDQAFNIDAFVDRIPGNSDAVLARSSLAEGEATLVMMEDSSQSLGMAIDLSTFDLDSTLGQLMTSMTAAQFPKFAEAPRVLRELLMFPYLKGMRFVGQAKRQGGWPRIDKIYSDLPKSSEQILHPEKYFSKRDNPITVSLSFLKGVVPKDWELLYEDVLGEFMLSEMLRGLPDHDEALRAAAGWGGDRYQVWRTSAGRAWLSLSAWDTPEDAVEFAGAFAKTVPERLAGAKLQAGDKSLRMTWKASDGRVAWVERHGSQVLVMFGFRPDEAEQVRAAAWGE